jgi:hypothetical protein
MHIPGKLHALHQMCCVGSAFPPAARKDLLVSIGGMLSTYPGPLTDVLDMRQVSKNNDKSSAEWRTSGYTPLMYAVQSGFEEMVDLLVSRGAKLNLVKNNGATALQVAIFNGMHPNPVTKVAHETPVYLRIAIKLLEHGAKLSVPGGDRSQQL